MVFRAHCDAFFATGWLSQHEAIISTECLQLPKNLVTLPTTVKLKQLREHHTITLLNLQTNKTAAAHGKPVPQIACIAPQNLVVLRDHGSSKPSQSYIDSLAWYSVSTKQTFRMLIRAGVHSHRR